MKLFDDISQHVRLLVHYRELAKAAQVYHDMVRGGMAENMALNAAANATGQRPRDLQNYLRQAELVDETLDEEADFDHLKAPHSVGRYSIAPHDFKGKSGGPVRYTGNYGDNAMEDEAIINEGDDINMLERLHGLLNAAEIDDDEIIAGVRLTQRGHQKVAAQLGIAASEVPALVNSLVAHLRDERRRSDAPIDESEGRYTYEEDALGNVLVRDTHSGREVFLRGSEAQELLTRLSIAGPGSTQTLLTQVDGLMEDTYGFDEGDMDFEHEMASQHDTFNFPWSYVGRSGVATARYGGDVYDFDLDIIAVRDEHGRAIEPDDHMMGELIRQAVAYFDKA